MKTIKVKISDAEYKKIAGNAKTKTKTKTRTKKRKGGKKKKRSC